MQRGEVLVTELDKKFLRGLFTRQHQAMSSEVFEAFGPVDARRMFGGYGIYRAGLMFGLVADDVLYLKADRESEARFTDRGLEAFEYDKGAKIVRMSYFMAPGEIYEEPAEASKWARLAYDAALRNAAGKR